MPHILKTFRQKCVSVVQIGPDRIRAKVFHVDNLFEGSVEIVAKVPDLEITTAIGDITSRRSFKNPSEIDRALRHIIGLRIAPGIKKQLKEIFRGEPKGKWIRSLVDEAVDGVILHLTKKVLENVPKDPEGERLHFQEMVKNNPRLFNSCAALSMDSPLMKGFKADERS